MRRSLLLQHNGKGHVVSTPGLAALRRPWLVVATLFFCFSIPFLLFRSEPFEQLHNWLTSSTTPPPAKPEAEPILPPPPPEIPGFYDWETRSSFNPIRQEDIASKSVDQLCAGFPSHLLKDIQPVLKTGHGVLETRVRPQLQSVSACLVNLLIMSDTEEQFEGHRIIDVIEDIPPSLRDNEKQLDIWRSGAIANGTADKRAAWRLDKFKFLPMISRSWRTRPDRKWYVFYEADTYIVWDNLFRMLEHFDPDEPHYFGSPTPGRQGTSFANGGPGYILSREAMRRLVQEDWDTETGAYLGSKLTERCWDDVRHNCCGDSVLAWALILQNVTLSGLFPMMTPHPPHGVPFSGSKKHWCQPVLTMHKPSEDDIIGLWRWQWEHRTRDQPLLYRDLATSYFNFSNLPTRHDWDNAIWDSFLARNSSDSNDYNAHESIDACKCACSVHDECFSWVYHLKQCYFNKSVRYGRYQEPSADSVKKHGDPQGEESDWKPEDLRFITGWNNEKIAKWIDDHPCEQVEWVHPSLKRIF